MVNINEIPAASGLSDAELADAIGRLDTFSKMVDEELKKLKDEAKVRINGVGTLTGNTYDIVVRSDVTWTLNTKALKDTYGEDWYFKHSKQSVRVTLNVKASKNLAA